MNYALLRKINGLAGHHRLLDDLMVFSAKYVIYLVFLVLVLVSLPFLRRREWRPLLWAGGALVLSFVLGRVATLVHPEQRPFTTHPALRVLTPHDPGTSFPSDHATAAFAIAFALLAFLSRRWGAVVAAAAVLIGFARVYDGIHYPGDILGAVLVAAVGVGVALAARAAVDRSRRSSYTTARLRM